MFEGKKFTRARFLGNCGKNAAAGFSLLYLANRSQDAIGFWGSDIPNGFQDDAILSLPQGFSYKIISKTGDPIAQGFKVPGAPDGMVCISNSDSNYVLMRNHEIDTSFSSGPYSSRDQISELAYDKAMYGGVSRIELSKNLDTIRENLVLTGTARNCAGGKSPYGYLTCEESVANNHGYVFLCDYDAEKLQPPRRIPSFGRFNHEAASMHEETLVTYLTEDRHDSCFYKHVPDNRDDPFKGSLYALRVKKSERFKTYDAMQVQDSLEVDWVKLDNIDSFDDSLRKQAQSKGAAIIERGEGLWIHGWDIYFASTSGGPGKRGQIFKVNDYGKRGNLKLIAQSNASRYLENPDNITIAPSGKLFVAEDGGGRNHIRYLDKRNLWQTLAVNTLSYSEMAGLCFSPDGKHLFVNIQKDGLTIAISGPFDQLV